VVGDFPSQFGEEQVVGPSVLVVGADAGMAGVGAVLDAMSEVAGDNQSSASQPADGSGEHGSVRRRLGSWAAKIFNAHAVGAVGQEKAKDFSLNWT
jgi:hypothetical protein